MEVDAAHRGMDELTDALDALEALKERMGDVFTEKAYQQRRKGLLKAALKDAKVAAKLEKGGGDTPSSAPQKLSWTLINSAVGNGHDWESAFASLPFEIISGEWKSDRASPTSQVGGQEASSRWRRCWGRWWRERSRHQAPRYRRHCATCSARCSSHSCARKAAGRAQT